MRTATLDAPARKASISPEEWKARQDLACAYRLFDHFGWHGLIFNHITVRVPGEGSHFLINPFGLMYREVTASNLVKIDVDGNILDGSAHKVNKAGFVIHSALHMASSGAHAIMHTHTNEGVAVSAQEEGLMPLSMSACGLQGHIAYHDYEGISLDTEERGRLIEHLGDKNCLILRHHGLLTCGRTLAEAFSWMSRLQSACEVQVMATAGASRPILPSQQSINATVRQMKQVSSTEGAGDMLWDAMTRWMVDKDARFLQ
ncbi:MAG: class II aldolase/adducin family protein [Betaproteobacteria bacterium]|nr:class II aldolase/adducin family protein [Betaproteobacteria bacterium]